MAPHSLASGRRATCRPSATEDPSNVRILLTGGTGLLGQALHPSLKALGTVEAPGRSELDLRRPDTIRAVVHDRAPDLVVNGAAYTDVDGAEDEPEKARAVNAQGPGVLADVCREMSVCLIHYSTDLVFDGALERPYTEEDEPRPLGVYGRTKREGERAVLASGAPHLVLRTAWLYGAGGENFVDTIIHLIRREEELPVVNDQRGSPTRARTVAEVTAKVLEDLLEGGKLLADAVRKRFEAGGGLFHLAAKGQVSRYEQARVIQREAARIRPEGGYEACILQPVTSSEYSQQAKRPANSALDSSRIKQTFGLTVLEWDAALRAYLEERLAG